MMPFDPLLDRLWVHSHEEDKGDEVVFRPSTFAFPPSRGRQGFALSADGAAQFTGPDSTDRAQSELGSWHMDDSGKLILKADSSVTRILDVLSVDPEKLVAKKPD